jgi:hypothetical protein
MLVQPTPLRRAGLPGEKRVAVSARGEEAVMQAFGSAEGNDARMKALHYILEAWEEGTGSGIAPELMAYAALYTALTDLVASYGEDSVVSLVNGLAPRVQKGEFTLYRSRQ